MLNVWQYIDPIFHPMDGDFNRPPTFDLERFFPKKEIAKFGLKRSVTFYEYQDESTETYINPLVAISWQTIFDNTTPKRQVIRTSFKTEDGWTDSTELSQPIRNPKVFLQTMRNRVIEELIDLATQFGFEKQIKALYEAHPTEIYIYKQGGSPKFREIIKASTEEWLTRDSTDGRTVKDVIVDYLSIAVVEDEAN